MTSISRFIFGDILIMEHWFGVPARISRGQILIVFILERLRNYVESSRGNVNEETFDNRAQENDRTE